MTPEKRPSETMPIAVDPRAIKAVEESRNREIMKAIRIMAAGAVISWGMLAYSWGRDGDAPSWTIPVVGAGLLIALYGRRVLDRGRGKMLDQLRTETQELEEQIE